MCSSSGLTFVHAVLYDMFFTDLCKESSRWQDVRHHIFPPAGLLKQKCEKCKIKPACTNGLPDDEHVMFATRRRHQELN